MTEIFFMKITIIGKYNTMIEGK